MYRDRHARKNQWEAKRVIKFTITTKQFTDALNRAAQQMQAAAATMAQAAQAIVSVAPPPYVAVARGKRWGKSQLLQRLYPQLWGEVDESTDKHESGGIVWDHTKAPTSAPDKMGYIYGYRQWLFKPERETPEEVVELMNYSILAPERLFMPSISIPARLYALNGRDEWDQQTRAKCNVEGSHRALTQEADITVPDPRCNCGLWGVFSPHVLPLDSFSYATSFIGRTAQAYGTETPILVATGIIRAWGVVVEGDKGFRAEYAEPMAFSDVWNPMHWAYPVSNDELYQESLLGLAQAFQAPVIRSQEMEGYYEELRRKHE